MIVVGLELGIVMKIVNGIEILCCVGFFESLKFVSVLVGLLVKLVFSVFIVMLLVWIVMVMLLYLILGFDWSVSYVVIIVLDGCMFDLFVWLMLVNGNLEVFVDVDV